MSKNWIEYFFHSLQEICNDDERWNKIESDCIKLVERQTKKRAKIFISPGILQFYTFRGASVPSWRNLLKFFPYRGELLEIDISFIGISNIPRGNAALVCQLFFNFPFFLILARRLINAKKQKLYGGFRQSEIHAVFITLRSDSPCSWKQLNLFTVFHVNGIWK